QVTFRPEREATAVVIPVRLVDFQNDALEGWVSSREVSAGGSEFTEALGVIPLGRRVGAKRRTIDHVELVVGLELRVQRQSEETALLHPFAQRDDLFPKIEKGLRGLFPIAVDELNETGLLGHKQSTRAVGIGTSPIGAPNSSVISFR